MPQRFVAQPRANGGSWQLAVSVGRGGDLSRRLGWQMAAGGGRRWKGSGWHETEDTAAVRLESAEDSATFASMAATTLIQAELPPELTDRARSFVEEGWATDMNELLAEALRRFLESHSGDLTEAMIQEDVNWGLHGKD